jgi:hypothetical protein
VRPLDPIPDPPNNPPPEEDVVLALRLIDMLPAAPVVLEDAGIFGCGGWWRRTKRVPEGVRNAEMYAEAGG